MYSMAQRILYKSPVEAVAINVAFDVEFKLTFDVEFEVAFISLTSAIPPPHLFQRRQIK